MEQQKIIGEQEKQEDHHSSQPSPTTPPYKQSELFGNNQNVNYSSYWFSDPWDKERQALHATGDQPLYKSAIGRVATRLVSRGIFGASFLTLGTLALQTWDPHLAFKDQIWYHKGFTGIAHACDTVFGKPIEVGVSGFYRMLGKEAEEAAKIGRNAVLFRPTRQFSPSSLERAKTLFDHSGQTSLSLPAHDLFGEKHKPLGRIMGRSLGEEMVGITADFAMGSIGDAVGRELVALFDPNYHKEWMKDGHVDLPGMGKAALKSVFRILSYNQMEDWAAALPYAYQCRIQRSLISKWKGKKYPHCEVQMDNQVGVFKLDENQNIQHSYMPISVMDLQARFMGYNWYTLLYRDLYNHVAGKIHDWKEHDYATHLHLPEHPIDACEHAFGETVKYVAKSFIKSMAYMAPAVPFFWMFRSPVQMTNAIFMSEDGPATKQRSEVGNGEKYEIKKVNPEDGRKQEYTTTPGSRDMLTVGDMRRVQVEGKHTWESQNAKGMWERVNKAVDGQPHSINDGGDHIVPTFGNTRTHPEWFKPGFDPYNINNYPNGGGLEKVLRPIGKQMDRVAGALEKHVLDPIGEKWHKDGLLKDKNTALGVIYNRHPNVMSSYHIANVFTHAAVSYTPYMIAKYETSNHIDTPIFDAAAYRFLDGIHHLDGKEFMEGLKDMGHLIVRAPVSEGTLKAAEKPRGLINSSYESLKKEDMAQAKYQREQLEIQRRKAAEKLHAGTNGWAAYEVARAQGRENGAPEGVTIH